MHHPWKRRRQPKKRTWLGQSWLSTVERIKPGYGFLCCIWSLRRWWMLNSSGASVAFSRARVEGYIFMNDVRRQGVIRRQDTFLQHDVVDVEFNALQVQLQRCSCKKKSFGHKQTIINSSIIRWRGNKVANVLGRCNNCNYSRPSTGCKGVRYEIESRLWRGYRTRSPPSYIAMYM